LSKFEQAGGFMNARCNDNDRDELIINLSRHLNKELIQVKIPKSRVKKLYKDRENNFYCVFIGKELWHGLYTSMLEALTIKNTGKVLLIAGVLNTDVAIADVYLGSFHNIVMNPSLLGNPNKNNQLDFKLILHGNTATLRESPDLVLKRIFSYKSQSGMLV